MMPIVPIMPIRCPNPYFRRRFPHKLRPKQLVSLFSGFFCRHVVEALAEAFAFLSVVCRGVEKQRVEAMELVKVRYTTPACKQSY
eukprot:1266109-Amphidinium_carterae.1